MNRRLKRPHLASTTVGWVEVWTNSPEALTCESVPLKRAQTKILFENGRYRFQPRKPLTQQGPVS